MVFKPLALHEKSTLLSSSCWSWEPAGRGGHTSSVCRSAWLQQWAAGEHSLPLLCTALSGTRHRVLPKLQENRGKSIQVTPQTTASTVLHLLMGPSQLHLDCTLHKKLCLPQSTVKLNLYSAFLTESGVLDLFTSFSLYLPRVSFRLFHALTAGIC